MVVLVVLEVLVVLVVWTGGLVVVVVEPPPPRSSCWCCWSTWSSWFPGLNWTSVLANDLDLGEPGRRARGARRSQREGRERACRERDLGAAAVRGQRGDGDILVRKHEAGAHHVVRVTRAIVQDDAVDGDRRRPGERDPRARRARRPLAHSCAGSPGSPSTMPSTAPRARAPVAVSSLETVTSASGATSPLG